MVDFVTGLRCRECARSFPAEALHVCDYCFGPLEVAYDYERIAAAISRERIEAGPRTIWRSRDLLPVDDASPVDLGAGFTPLIRADRLAAELGLGELWIKDDTANPTGSFKDRVVSVALTKARQLGFKIAEQLGWQAPDHVVVPIGSGSQLTKVAKGFSELGKVGLLPEEPSVRVSGAQAEGCAPVATAFLGGTDAIRPVKPKTIAKSLAIGNPADGWYALDVIRRSGGSCAAVTDGEI